MLLMGGSFRGMCHFMEIPNKQHYNTSYAILDIVLGANASVQKIPNNVMHKKSPLFYLYLLVFLDRKLRLR